MRTPDSTLPNGRARLPQLICPERAASRCACVQTPCERVSDAQQARSRSAIYPAQAAKVTQTADITAQTLSELGDSVRPIRSSQERHAETAHDTGLPQVADVGTAGGVHVFDADRSSWTANQSLQRRHRQRSGYHFVAARRHLDELDAVACCHAQRIAYRCRDGDLAFGGQRGCTHVSILGAPYAMVRTRHHAAQADRAAEDFACRLGRAGLRPLQPLRPYFCESP